MVLSLIAAAFVGEDKLSTLAPHTRAGNNLNRVGVLDDVVSETVSWTLRRPVQVREHELIPVTLSQLCERI
jgi:hypothetical protein